LVVSGRKSNSVSPNHLRHNPDTVPTNFCITRLTLPIQAVGCLS
jgi:hypothetical protein